MRAHAITAILGAACLTVALTGCSSSSSSSASVPTCDADTLLAAANAGVTNDEDKASAMNGVQCEGDGQIDVTDVFKATDGVWQPVDRNAVCGTIDMNAPAERPSDAQVPETIWAAACNTNVGIFNGRHNTRHARLHDGMGARASDTEMAARFQAHI